MNTALIVLSLALAGAAKVVVLDARGEPEMEIGTQPAVWAWTDAKGLHLRWWGHEQPVLFSGSIEVDKAVGEIARTNKLAGGWIDKKDDNNVFFSATATAALDGADLVVPVGASVLLTLEVDGAPANPSVLFVGAKLAHPTALPVKFAVR